MPEKIWTDVENFIDDTLIGRNKLAEMTLAANAAAGLPPIGVSPNQGKFLQILARSVKARRISGGGNPWRLFDSLAGGRFARRRAAHNARSR